jgi:hypothetical protein
MTAQDFRQLALSFPDTSEQSHMHHPDFRVAGKIFATLGYPDATCAMVKLTRQQQARFAADHPEAFVPVNGTWGKRGCTSVKLRSARKTIVREALKMAWRNAAPARLAGQIQLP